MPPRPSLFALAQDDQDGVDDSRQEHQNGQQKVEPEGVAAALLEKDGQGGQEDRQNDQQNILGGGHGDGTHDTSLPSLPLSRASPSVRVCMCV